MSAYQRFLDFFSKHGKERLDGFSEAFLSGMSEEEWKKAFDFLLERVKRGGTEESIVGLFLADAEHASKAVKELLENNALHDEAKIIAVWQLYRRQPDAALLHIFISAMCSKDKNVRGKAAYYLPSDKLIPALIPGLKKMISAETDRIARIHAVNKLLECYEVSNESVGRKAFSRIYRDLHSEDMQTREAAFRTLDAMYE